MLGFYSADTKTTFASGKFRQSLNNPKWISHSNYLLRSTLCVRCIIFTRSCDTEAPAGAEPLNRVLCLFPEFCSDRCHLTSCTASAALFNSKLFPSF